MSLGRSLLRLAKGILAKSLIRLLGTELLIGESLVSLGVDCINLLHLFKKEKKTPLYSGSLPLLNPRQILLCAGFHLGFSDGLCAETRHCIKWTWETYESQSRSSFCHVWK